AIRAFHVTGVQTCALPIFREADGYRLKRINEAEGDASRFSALLAEYSKAPEVTRRRIYIETMQNVLPQLGSKVVVDDSASSVLPLLNLTSKPVTTTQGAAK